MRSLCASIAANERWAYADGHVGTRAARDAFLLRFEREVDPDGVLPADERANVLYGCGRRI
jgi:hypothetical protein